MAFVHLHNHTQYSLLDGACRIDKMLEQAKNFGMSAVAMTDHGNLFGAIDFYQSARKAGIKPIIGIEAYLMNGDIRERKKASRYHLVLLAKDITGYKNLIKLTSLSYLDGFYYKPRINKELLKKYSAGLICLSACIKGEVAAKLLSRNKKEAERVLTEYKNIFGKDFYIELQDHDLEDEKKVMPELIKLAQETDTPLVVTNDCHYIERSDSEAHDVLLCIQTGKSLADNDRMKYNTNQLYFKSEEEMRRLFPDLPEAYENTNRIAEIIDLELDYDRFLLPEFKIPATAESNLDYLRQLCNEAVPLKYGKMTKEIEERIEYEISVIRKMGFVAYFLIVKDIIDSARKMDIPVGPGRGSAAGSIVSFLLDITRIDPIKYGLFFERFLNQERIGMPDIDIDFCAEGRGQVIDYIVRKYGRQSVTQIVTFSLLGAKSVIKDVARVLEVPAAEANVITKLIPSTPKITLHDALEESPEFAEKMRSNDIYASVLTYSKVLEGLIRHIGIHAAGVVIGPGNLTDYVPLATTTQKGSPPAVIVQYEGKWLDELKMLKMDILGLKTLSIIEKTVKMIRESEGIDIDIENLDLTDKETFNLLAKGITDGIFQFESTGMKKYLIELQPNKFDDLIAMVALYRPGPMQFIDSFIKRKHGKQKVNLYHTLMENALQETYGVTVYQEQVMQIARDMGGFSGSEADTLRKAMGKKKISLMEKLKKKFIEGAEKKGVKSHIIEKVWSDWQEFAKYAFNKSHATAYALIAFQTAYLKAHYPVQFMASLLSLEENTTKIPYFIEECRQMGIEVIPPEINRSGSEFIAEGKKIIFGLKAIKNVGSAAIDSIMAERDENGRFENLFEFASRVDSMVVNKAVLESLIASGALDLLEGHRAQNYRAVENALEYASSVQTEKKRGQLMLFDSFEEDESTFLPKLPKIKEWTLSEKLKKEKEILGFYWSGHPLNQHKYILEHFVNITTETAEYDPGKIPAKIAIAGVVTNIIKKRGKKGNAFAILTLEDLYGKFEVTVFSENYQNNINKIAENEKLFIIGKRSSYSNGNENILRILPEKIFLIDELADNLSGKIFLKFKEEIIDKEFSKTMLQHISSANGKFDLYIDITTEKFKKIRLHPAKIKIFPRPELFNFLENEMQIESIVHLNLDN